MNSSRYVWRRSFFKTLLMRLRGMLATEMSRFPARYFVGCQCLSQSSQHDGFHVGQIAFPRDCRDYGFAKVGMRYAEDGRLCARKQGVQRIFDFLRIDFQTTRNDQIFRAAQKFDAAHLVNFRNIPRHEPAIARECRRIRFRTPPIT